jgi:uncharacterized protein
MKPKFFYLFAAMTSIFSVLGLSISNVSNPLDKKAKHRVVIQVSTKDTAEWSGLINNITNLKNGWGSDVEIEVVAHGPGIDLLRKSKTNKENALIEFKSQGIVFLGCENTMKRKNIPLSDIIEAAGTVPMGIGEVIMKQEKGWSYLKAGF